MFKFAVCPLSTPYTSGRGYERHPIRLNNRPFWGELIVYRVSSVQDKAGIRNG